MKHALWSTGLATLLATGPLYARDCRGIAFPEHVSVHGTNLALNGLGVRKATLFKVNVYVAALYVPSPTHDPQALLLSGPSELTLQFVRSVSGKQMREAWTEGFEKTAKDHAAFSALEQRVEMLNGWMTDIESGQRMTFVRTPGTGISVEVNGAPKGTIPGDDFARAFLSIWLGDAPPNPELKDGLLGGHCD